MRNFSDLSNGSLILITLEAFNKKKFISLTPFCMAVLDITSNYNQSSMYYKWETKIQNGNNGNI